MLEISQKLRDLGVKVIGVPFAALLVSMLYNLLDTEEKINWQTPDYLILLTISFVLWIGNVKIHYLLRKKLFQIKKIILRLMARYGINILFSWICTLVCLHAWNYFLHQSLHSNTTILLLQVIMIIITLQVSTFYEIVYLNNERDSDLVKMERTEKLKIQAELDVLKHQIDPHFIFNSLNTLSYLISQDQRSARLFNDTLAKVYRYILLKKEKDLVLLKEEIEFTTNYFYLLKIRYQFGLNMKIEMEDIVTEDYLLPPLSIQMLIENAIKHNHFTEKVPLNIQINILKDLVTVNNNRNVKQFEIQSSGIGLANLNERYRLITNKNIDIADDRNVFSVSLPILKS